MTPRDAIPSRCSASSFSARYLFAARRAAFDVDHFAGLTKRHDGALEGLAVDLERKRSAVVVAHADAVFRAPAFAHHRVIRQLSAHAGLDLQAVMLRLDAQDVLRNGDEV